MRRSPTVPFQPCCLLDESIPFHKALGAIG
jgi:hypothetical protein